jgi:DNA excision repair protein ERCC-3
MIMTEEILSKWNAAHEKLEAARQAIDDFQGLVRQLQEQQAKQVESLKLPTIPNLDENAIREFLKQPYLLMPRRENNWYVIVPRFIDMQVGWLEYQTPSFNVFVINKYVRWLTPLPAEIESRLGMKPAVDIKVVDGLLKPAAGMEDETWQRYRKYLTRKDQFGLRIKQGYERHLISDLIRDGYLPFTPQPVDPEDLNPIPEGFTMEPHQKEAYDAFLKWGAIGIYWPGGQGKTYWAAALCKMVKGPKLVVVPNVSEKEQWLVYLRRFGATGDVDLLTYQAFHKTKKNYKFAVFDECHRLPAPVWSRFATIESKYRLGLSATPYREDGREDLIIALTGYPVGLSWEHFMRVKAIRKPKVTVKVVNNDRDKMAVLEDMLKVPMKTLVFVELIASGEKISKQFNLPFVYGATKDRLEIISKNLVTVVSRVGDEGISIKDLERTVEVEFLGSSRRQEAQRAYRLLHSVKPEISHTVIMTVAELDQFSGRFLALEEKGFQVEYVS